MTYEVREVMDLDAVLPELKALHEACHNELPATKGLPFAYRYDLLEAYWKAGVLRIFGAFHDGKLVGHASGYVSVSMRTGQSIATEDVLYVLPEHRKGVGHKLTAATVAAAKALGIHRYLVTVPIGNEAARVCAEKAGFKPVGTVFELQVNP